MKGKGKLWREGRRKRETVDRGREKRKKEQEEEGEGRREEERTYPFF